MAEYAGYVKRGTPINWGTVANDLVKKIGNVEKEQAAFREKYDSIAAKTSAEIGKYEAGQSPQLNDLAYNMIADGRTTLSALHEKLKRREISPDAFNRAAMSMQTQNQEFKTMLNTYNANVADLEKGISDGTLSSLSDFQLDVYQDISDLSNKKFQWASNPDGITNLYVNTIDKDGNPVKQPMSLSSIRDMGNMRYEKYDIDTNLAKSIKSLGVYDINNISDARNNPQYSKWKESLINDATVGDRAATILADYGDFVPYKQGDDIPKDKDGNNIGIEMVLKPNGQYEPNITPELRNKAKTIVDESIEARLGRTVRPGKAAKDKKRYGAQREAEISEGYDATISASEGDFKFMDNTKYKFFKDPDGKGGFTITVTDKKSDKILLSGLESGSRETAKALAPYYPDKFGGTDWEYIDKNKKRKPKKDPTFTPRTYKLEDNIADIDVIEDIGTTSNNDILESKAKIKNLILRSSPNARVRFGKLDDEGVISELKVIVNGKEFTIKTDASVTQKLNPLSTYDQENKDTFQEMINHSYGDDSRTNNNVAENNQKKDFG